MPGDGRGADGGKTRKRGCSSTTSTSSVLQRCRLKRAILMGKKGGSTTPVPAWRMNAGLSPSSAAAAAGISDSLQWNAGGGGRGLQAPVSARKLATALWEMNEVPRPPGSGDKQERRTKKELRGRSRIASDSLPRQLSHPSHSLDLEIMGVMPVGHEKFRHNRRASDLLSSASLMETDARSQGPTPKSSVVGMKNRLKDLKDGLMTSKELLKLVGHIWGLKEKHASALSLVSALHVEMDQACVHVDHLIEEQITDQNTVNCLKQQFAEERSKWKSKEEGIRAVVFSLMAELESEKRLRMRAERMNKKLGLELARMRTSLLKAVKELENEKRSKNIIEQICNELVRGIGDDKAEVAELKRESTKIQEELEKEREMLQLADEWREERVQMKLSEAKFQLEEKNAAVDQLRNELETFLTTKKTEDPTGRHMDVAGLEVENYSELVQPSKNCSTTNIIVNEREQVGELDGRDEEDDELDSVDSDLQELQKERELFQIAGEWERGQIKISEAKNQFEEKNAAIDRLRNELEAYLTAKKAEEHTIRHQGIVGTLAAGKHSQLDQPNKRCRGNNLIGKGREEAGELEDTDEEDDAVSSVDSDLHSIELNMDSSKKSYCWSYATGSTKGVAKLDLVADKKPGRFTNCNQVPINSVCLDSCLNINEIFQHLGDGPDVGLLSESSNLLESQARKLDQERYTSVKGLRDQMLAASRFAQSQGLSSPIRQWSRSQASHDMVNQVPEGLKITETVKAARENGMKARLGITNTQSQLEMDPIR